MERDEVSHACDDDVSTPFIASLNSDSIPQTGPLSTNVVKQSVGEDQHPPVVSSTMEALHEQSASSNSPIHPPYRPWGNLAPALTQSRIFLDVCCGVNRPLSAAVLARQMVILSFDILCNAECDILDDIQFERLLRICASGIVAYCATSPPCKEFSRLKLRPGGPQALRTPSQLDGRPGLTADESMTLQTSHLMLSRCVLCGYLTYDAGGHSHLEQPSSAMSWQEPVVQSYIQHCNCFCAILAACGYGLDIEKSWLFCSTLEAISAMAYLCEHPRNSHQPVAGVRTASGAYLSKYTAEYPPQLASKFADHVLPLLSHGPHDLDLHSAEQLLPVKSMQAGDWSSPPAGSSDVFKTLRHNWMQLIMKQRMDVQLVASLQQQSNGPPFSSQQLAPFTQFLVEFLEAQGYPVNWDIPSDQPMHLHILHSLQKILGDPDVALFPYLLEGVPTGFDGPIQSSNCFPLSQPDDSAESPLLSVHHCNWSSAEDHPDEVRALIDEEVKNGWVTPFHGSLADAQEQWPLGGGRRQAGTGVG